MTVNNVLETRATQVLRWRPIDPEKDLGISGRSRSDWLTGQWTPGLFVRIKDSTDPPVLVGDINILGGSCDHCLELPRPRSARDCEGYEVCDLLVGFVEVAKAACL